MIADNIIPELVEFYKIMDGHAGKTGGVKFTRRTIIVPDDKFVNLHLIKTLLWIEENHSAFKMSILFSVENVVNSKLAQAFIESIEHQISHQTKTSFYQEHDLSRYKYRLTDFQTDLLDYFLSKESHYKNEVKKMLHTIKEHCVAIKSSKGTLKTKSENDEV